MHRLLLLILIPLVLSSSEVPNFKDLKKSKDVVFFYSTKRSGSNLISSSLSAITRKPISWVKWGNSIFDPTSKKRNDPSYNRLGLKFVSEKPLLYRTHGEFSKFKQFPSKFNKLIFVTRNPKELLYRQFFLNSPASDNPDPEFIDSFLKNYLQAFETYESWDSSNKFIVFYEDFIKDGDQILLKLLSFMNEEPIFLEDFLSHKQEYMVKLHESYKNQHERNLGGSSSIGGAKDIYYSKNASLETLLYIDDVLQKMAPRAWEGHLKRFRS